MYRMRSGMALRRFLRGDFLPGTLTVGVSLPGGTSLGETALEKAPLPEDDLVQGSSRIENF